MKYSILMPYVKRAGHLHNTFISFVHHYSKRLDYQVIIGEDFKNIKDSEEHKLLMDVIHSFSEKIQIELIQDFTENTWNPARIFNKCAQAATGKFLILTNPEGFHEADVLSGLDDAFHDSENYYVVCSSKNMKGCNLFIERFEDLGGNLHIWYQHSEHRNRMLHFCTALSKENFIKIGGFNEAFIYGSGKEDVEFLKRVIKSHMKIITRDDLITVHIAHDKVVAGNKNPHKLRSKNKQLLGGMQ